MKLEKVITLLLLMLPSLSWGVFEPIPEPGILPLLAAGGVAAIAVKIMRRKK